MTVLKEVIADDLEPTSKGGIIFYPASELHRIFEWAQDAGRTLEWVEGIFYQPGNDESSEV